MGHRLRAGFDHPIFLGVLAYRVKIQTFLIEGDGFPVELLAEFDLKGRFLERLIQGLSRLPYVQPGSTSVTNKDFVARRAHRAAREVIHPPAAVANFLQLYRTAFEDFSGGHEISMPGSKNF